MDRRESLTSRIVAMEWEMFRNAPSIGGPAPCQLDQATFEVARASQTMSWSEAALESYLDDLQKAEKQGRNLVTEKYARMMKSTSPVDYARIEHLLPAVDPECLALIDKITDIVLAWGKELSVKYPGLMKRARPLYGTDAAPSDTSIETYFRGELATYSLRTLELYLENNLRQQSEKMNGAEIVLDCTVKRYGYNSLAEAEQKIKAND
ncbi:MAG: DUF4125 family protein [Geobacteraceae bacterium]|nr:DUF4125 family protein [Geobacteraceae bacterium]